MAKGTIRRNVAIMAGTNKFLPFSFDYTKYFVSLRQNNIEERMKDETTERLSPQSDSGEAPINDILENAEAVARRVFESIQALAGTETCKGVQIARLKDWAIANNHWISDIKKLGTFSDRGSENEVYLSFEDEHFIYKLNDFRYSDDNLTPFFNRIKAHNELFPECQYTLVGFAENQENKVCAVLKQGFVLSEREALTQEIGDEMVRLGFHKEDDGYFSNGDYDIFDAVPNNVLMGVDGHLYFIDTIIFKSGTGGLNTYRSLSPRCSGK